MNDLMREQMFAQWLISKTLALYMTQDDFREEVNSKVNDGYTFSINGEKMNNFEQTEWKLHMVCVDIARQFTEYYFNDFIADEAEQTEPQTETEMAKAIVHKMIDDAVIAEDAYPNLRQKMHDAVDEYEPQTEPQTCEECEHWNDPDDGCADRHGCKTEPQTESPCDNCQEFDCYGCEYKQTERSSE